MKQNGKKSKAGKSYEAEISRNALAKIIIPNKTKDSYDFDVNSKTGGLIIKEHKKTAKSS